jgi:hypothetical protein
LKPIYGYISGFWDSKATKDNAGSLKKLAVAAEQTQKGYDALEKGYVD